MTAEFIDCQLTVLNFKHLPTKQFKMSVTSCIPANNITKKPLCIAGTESVTRHTIMPMPHQYNQAMNTRSEILSLKVNKQQTEINKQQTEIISHHCL